MDPIEKALARLTLKERAVLQSILERIRKGDLRNLGIKKLQARDDVFRVRKGTMRIIFRIAKTRDIFIP